MTTVFITRKIPETGLKLLSQNLPLSDRPPHGIYIITLILSLLGTAYSSGLISEMNYNILKFEFEGLIPVVEAEEKERSKGAVLSNYSLEIPKGQDIMSDSLKRPLGIMSVKKTQEKSNKSSSVNRQDIIVDLLKKNHELGIKDFTSNIKDCSEKTIQRILVSLVSKGFIKKKGEKRWSRYSIK